VMDSSTYLFIFLPILFAILFHLSWSSLALYSREGIDHIFILADAMLGTCLGSLLVGEFWFLNMYVHARARYKICFIRCDVPLLPGVSVFCCFPCCNVDLIAFLTQSPVPWLFPGCSEINFRLVAGHTGELIV
jgi:uncharacterized membrane protein